MTPRSDGGGEKQEKPSAQGKRNSLGCSCHAGNGVCCGGHCSPVPGHERRGIKSIFTAVPPGLQEKKLWAVQFQRLKKKIQSEKSSGFTEIIPE